MVEIQTLEALRKICCSYGSVKRHVYGDVTAGVPVRSYLTFTKAPKVRVQTWGKRAVTESEVQQQKQQQKQQRQQRQSDKGEESKVSRKCACDPPAPAEELLDVGRAEQPVESEESDGEGSGEEGAVWAVPGEEEAARLNLKVRRHRGSDAKTGVEVLTLPLLPQQLAELTAAILAGFAAGKQSGKRVSCKWSDPALPMEVVAKGYRDYHSVHGRHNPAEQFKATCVLGPLAPMWQYCRLLPHLSCILAFVCCQFPGREVAFVHLLDQTSDQAKFDLHTDNAPHLGDGYDTIELSCVFCLTDGPSSMQVAGYEVFSYDGAGQGCVFHSALWHASVHAAPGTPHFSGPQDCKMKPPGRRFYRVPAAAGAVDRSVRRCAADN
eukprot:4521833-Prymnesium_polylepis.1